MRSDSLKVLLVCIKLLCFKINCKWIFFGLKGSSEDRRVEQSSLPCLGSTREQASSLTTDTGYSLEEMDALPPLDESDYPEFYLAPDARPSGTSSVYAQNTFGCGGSFVNVSLILLAIKCIKYAGVQQKKNHMC